MPVTLLVLLGAALRAFRLGGQSLWVDEMLTLNAANVGGSLSPREMFWNIQGPLHGALIHLISWFSTSEAALRAPSALAGVATIPVVYLLGREMAGRRAGLLAALFAAVSPFGIWYSQEVRNYAFLVLFCSVATLLAWRLMARSSRAWSAYVLTVTFALYSNLSAAFLAIAHNLFGLRTLFSDGRLLRRWVGAYVLIILLFVPMAAGLARWFELDDVGRRVAPVHAADEEELLRGETTFTPLAVPYAVFSMVYGYSLGPSLRELHVRSPLEAYVANAAVVAPAGLVAALALLLGLRRLSRWPRALGLALWVMCVPVVAAGLLAFFNIKPFNVRYVAAMFPVLMVALGAGVASLRGWRAFALGAVVTAFLVLSLYNYYFDPEYWREDVRAAAGHVAANERPGDVVLVPSVAEVFDFYYEGDADIVVLYPAQTRSEEEIHLRLTPVLDGGSRLWFVDSRLWFSDPQRRIPAYLDGRFEREEAVDFPGARVGLYNLEEGR